MVVYLLFIFFVGIVLLNLLIAQMNKTYENIEKEVRREYYYTLARVLSRYRKSMGPLPSKRFLTISENCICTVRIVHCLYCKCVPCVSARGDIELMLSDIRMLAHIQ